MPQSQSDSNRNSLIVLFAAVGVCILTATFLMPYVPDDSYISFRYAENLAKGNGLTFNEGGPGVEGYSNLLWILLCAFLYRMGFELPSFMPYVGTLLAILSIVLLWTLFRRRGCPPLQMLLPLLALATSGPFMMYAVSGMEMPLYGALLLMAIIWVDLIFLTGRLLYYILLATTGVLVAMCRPEGAHVFPVIVVAIFYLTRKDTADTPFHRTRMKNLIIASIVFAVMIVAYNVWRITYFGELLPTPLLSKGGGGVSILNAWGKNIIIYFWRQAFYFPPVGYYFAALSAAAVFGVLASTSTKLLKNTERIALTTALTSVFVYFNFVDWMPGMRYHSAIVCLLLIPGIHIQSAFFEVKKMDRPRLVRFWLAGIAVILMSYSVLAELRIIAARTEESNQQSLIPLAKWLRETLPGDCVLAMSDVGALPYYSGFKTVDIHPESLLDVHIAKNGLSVDYFYRQDFDIVIIPSYSMYLTKFLPDHYAIAEDPRFQRLYRLVGVVRYDWYNDRSYWVMVSKKHPPIGPEQMERFPEGVGTISRRYK